MPAGFTVTLRVLTFSPAASNTGKEVAWLETSLWQLGLTLLKPQMTEQVPTLEWCWHILWKTNIFLLPFSIYNDVLAEQWDGEKPALSDCGKAEKRGMKKFFLCTCQEGAS